MSSFLRKLVTVNFFFLGIMLLDKPLQGLSELPESSLAMLIRTAARYLGAVVTLASIPARAWLWVSTPLLLVLLLLQGFGKLSGAREKGKEPAASGNSFWLNALLVAAWFAAFGFSLWSAWI
jgi:hypothetical protein